MTESTGKPNVGEENGMSRSEVRAWYWVVAASIAGLAAGQWQLRVSMEEFAVAVRMREHFWLWHAWVAAPWIYLPLQAVRVRGFPLGLSLVGMLGMATVVAGVLVWQLRLEQLPVERRVLGIGMLPVLQAGVLAFAGLGLWAAKRWMVLRNPV